MIQANELRIGNWIKKEFWYKKAIEYYQIKHSHFANNKIMLFEPIPITEEWLLKFGFEKCEFLKNTWDNGNIIISLKYDTFCYELLNDVVELKYIHQLQNLYFAITQKELEYVGTN